MNRKTVLAAMVAVAVLLAVSGWLIYGQFRSLQVQITDLQAQNSELQNQNSDLQNQTIGLQNQTRQLQDRVEQLLEQLEDRYNSPVQITAFEWLDGFNPIVGMTLGYPVTVTIRNGGNTAATGLSLTVKLIDLYNGTQIGQSGGTDVTTLQPGETREIKTVTFGWVGVSLEDTACVITLKSGNTVLDEWTRSIR